MKPPSALFAGLLIGAAGLSVGSGATAQSARAYGGGDICAPAPGRPALACRDYPRGITYHRPNCRWVEETYGGKTHDFEICLDRDGIWRPSGRG